MDKTEQSRRVAKVKRFALLQHTRAAELRDQTRFEAARDLLTCCELAESAESLAEATERALDALLKLRAWVKAYPLDIFPEPDLARARAALEDRGMALDAISASAMRHVLNGVAEIIGEALGPEEPPGNNCRDEPTAT